MKGYCSLSFMLGPLAFRNSAGVSSTGKLSVSVQQRGAERPVLGVRGQICSLCKFAWTFSKGGLLDIPALEIEEMTFLSVTNENLVTLTMQRYTTTTAGTCHGQAHAFWIYVLDR